MSIKEKTPVHIGLFGHIDSGKTKIASVLSEIISTAGIDAHPQSKEASKHYVERASKGACPHSKEATRHHLDRACVGARPQSKEASRLDLERAFKGACSSKLGSKQT